LENKKELLRALNPACVIHLLENMRKKGKSQDSEAVKADVF